MVGTSKLNGQDEANRKVYFAPGAVRYYLSESLTPQEETCLRLCHAHIAGKTVLDIGVGAGRTTRYLQPLADRYEAVDYSPVMVRFMQQAMPGVSVRQADWRDLSAFADENFDFIFATSNVIDALGHEDRLKALAEARRLLRSGGVLAFSAHNLKYRWARRTPRLQWSNNPLRLPACIAQYLRSRKNYLRLRELHSETAEYAVVTDEGHDYACLHYYAARETVARQLANAGLRLIDVIDHQGHAMAAGDDESGSPNFMYIAARV